MKNLGLNQKNQFTFVFINFLMFIFFFFFLKAIAFNAEYLLAPILTVLFIFPVIVLSKPFLYNEKTFLFGHRLRKFVQMNSSYLIVFFSSVFVVVIFGRVLSAKWNVIDDHEIIYFLGGDGKLYWKELFSTLSITEVGNFGLQPRYRPFYYLMRIIECILWGGNPFYWHFIRVVILILAVSLYWKLISYKLGWALGGLLSAYTLSFFYWFDVIGKLGPGETYTVLGLPIYIWGFTMANSKGGNNFRRAVAGLAIFLGSVICIGSKENFVLLAIPSLYIFIKALKTRDCYVSLSAWGSICFAIYECAAIFLLLFHSKVDVYGNLASPILRMLTLLSSLFEEVNRPLIFLSILILSIGGLNLLQKIPGNIRATMFKINLWLLVLFGLYGSQLIFYNGVWPRGNRYDFPGILYIPIATLLFYLIIEKILINKTNIDHSQVVVKIAFGIALLIIVMSKGYNSIVTSLDEYVRTTRTFSERVNKTKLLLNENPESVLVIESGDVWDYEPIFSYERFLRNYGVKNQIFLRIHGYSINNVETEFERNLASQLLEVSNNGKWNFTPLAQLGKYSSKCYSIELSGKYSSDCQVIE